MRFTRKIIAIVFSVFGALLMAAATTSPQAADSNIAEWLRVLGNHHPPAALVTSHADQWAFWLGLVVLLVGVLGVSEWFFAPKRGPYSEPILIIREFIDRHFHHVDAAETVRFSDSVEAEIKPGTNQLSPSQSWFRRGIEDEIERQSLDRKAKWEAERQIQNTPQRDVGLAEALAYAEFKEWRRSFFDAASSAKNEADEQTKRFRQLAYDGVLMVWGKRSESGVFQLIPKGHWLDHNVEWFDLLRGTARTENVMRTVPGPFVELMVCKAEFEREWPHV